jgi:hypothetical protein
MPLLLWSHYCYVLLTLYLAGFYGAFIPEIFIISLLGILLFYWVQRVYSILELLTSIYSPISTQNLLV